MSIHRYWVRQQGIARRHGWRVARSPVEKYKRDGWKRFFR
jgi:hypothetical protein